MFNQFREFREKDGVDFSIHPVTLGFQDRKLEKEFGQSYFQTNLQVGRSCHLVAIFFYGIVALWDTFVNDPSRLNIWSWVFSVVTLIFLLGLGSSYFARKFYARYWQQIFAFYVLITGAGFTLVTVVTSPNYPIYNFAGIIICLFFCYTFIRLTFVWAVAAGNLIVAIYIISTWFFVNPPLMPLLTDLFYMFGINLLGMMVNYSQERMSRRDFVLNTLLKRAENKTKNMNVRLDTLVRERTRELTRANQDLEATIQREKDLVLKLKSEEAILQKSLNSLQQAEAIAKLGYFERNWQTEEFYWSPGFFNLLGYENSGKPLTHDEFMEFIHEQDRKAVAEHIQLSLEKQEPMDIEFRLIHKNGNIIQIHEVAENFYSDEGNLPVTRGIFQDITDRKKAEVSLRKLERQLIQAQKMESVGRLAGGVAHDYNNISSIIIGYSELALEKVAPGDPLHDDLTAILTAAIRSTEITRQLLAFARRQTIAPKVIDLNETVESMLKMLRRLIGEDIDLAWLPGQGVWPIKIDSTQVDQILANLCVNARDAISGVGKLTIEIKNTSLDDAYCTDHSGFIPGDYVALAVSDDGKGVAPENLDKIFEPFFTTKKIGKGTGLGLSTVYGIIKQNKGFVNIYSELNSGTTITVYFPRCRDGIFDSLPEKFVEIPESRGEKILLVEDDASILKLGKRILEDQGYTVMTAGLPRDAVNLAKNHAGQIDLLITDVVMPEMNGRDLANELKQLHSSLKILFMSGYTADVIAHRGVLEEGVCFIPKPFSKKDFAVKVRSVLDETGDSVQG